jgi:hypothetical protein
MGTPARLCQRPFPAPANRSLARSSLAAVLPAARRAFTSAFVLSILAASALAVLPEIAFGQRSGGGGGSHGSGHASGGGGHFSSGNSRAEGAATPRPSPTVTGARGATASGSPEHTGSAMASSSRIVPPDSAHFGSNEVTPARSGQRRADSTPRSVTIGFPPRSPDEPRISSFASGSRTTFTGGGNHFWEERVRDAPTVVDPQRPMTPVAAPRMRLAPSIPRDYAQPASLTKQASRDRTRATVLLSIDRPGVIGPPHIWPRRKSPPRSTYGTLGFFGFGFGSQFLGFGLGAECDPFSVEPWASGCNTLGYWNGDNSDYNADYDARIDQTDAPQGIEQSLQEPPSVYVPAPESSREEIGTKKASVVLYMKTGSAYAVTDYWIADGKLHYRPSYGGENTIEMDDLNLQQTVDANAKSGVNFTLRPQPE